MTTGEYLVAHSTLPSGTALQHLLALQIGSGSGETVFASQFVATLEQPDSVATVVPKRRSAIAPLLVLPFTDRSADEENLFCTIAEGKLFSTVVLSEVVVTLAAAQQLVTRKFEQGHYAFSNKGNDYLINQPLSTFTTVK